MQLIMETKTTNTIQALGAHLGSGLIFKDEDGELRLFAGISPNTFYPKDFEVNTLDINGEYFILSDRIDNITPICYGWDMLTKEITVKGYNDGEPFEPIKELGEQDSFTDYNYDSVIKEITRQDYGAHAGYAGIDYLPYYAIKLLISWHFPVGLTDFIEVTEENNPY